MKLQATSRQLFDTCCLHLDLMNWLVGFEVLHCITHYAVESSKNIYDEVKYA